jgi:hypothetical protein
VTNTISGKIWFEIRITAATLGDLANGFANTRSG